LTPVPEDSTCVADGNRCQGNGVAIAVNGGGSGGGGGSVARGHSPRPPPVAVKRSCLRQTSDPRAAAAVPPSAATLSDLELPRSPRRADIQRLPARLRVGGENANATQAAADQSAGDNNNHNGNNNDDTGAATTTSPTNLNHVDTEHLSQVDPTLFPLGVRLTTV